MSKEAPVCEYEHILHNAKAYVDYWLELDGFGMKNPALIEFAKQFRKVLDGELPPGDPATAVEVAARSSERRSKPRRFSGAGTFP